MPLRRRRTLLRLDCVCLYVCVCVCTWYVGEVRRLAQAGIVQAKRLQADIVQDCACMHACMYVCMCVGICVCSRVVCVPVSMC